MEMDKDGTKRNIGGGKDEGGLVNTTSSLLYLALPFGQEWKYSAMPHETVINQKGHTQITC